MHILTYSLIFAYFRYRKTQRKSRHERDSGSRRLKDEIPLDDIETQPKDPFEEGEKTNL